MITEDEILMGRDEDYPIDAIKHTNLVQLLGAVNKLRMLYNQPMFVSSGYRPGHYNDAAKGAPNSSHMQCQAVDFHDRDNKIKEWITEEILEQCGLYMEAPGSTPTWCHVQIRPTKKRIFNP